MKWFELFWMMMCIILIGAIFGDAIVSVLTGIVSFVGETTTTMIDAYDKFTDSLPESIKTILFIIILILTGVWMIFYMKNHSEK